MRRIEVVLAVLAAALAAATTPAAAFAPPELFVRAQDKATHEPAGDWLALAASLVPTTAAAHQYWTIEDPAARAQQKIHFWKNASLLGGLLLVAFD